MEKKAAEKNAKLAQIAAQRRLRESKERVGRQVGLLPWQNETYSSMAEASLRSVEPPQATHVHDGNFAPNRLPRPRGNEFYEASRFWYRAPVNPPFPKCSACVGDCHPDNPRNADIKCYTCVKFDPARLGLFCQQCFAARHPWHRVKHSWLPLSEAEDMHEAVGHQRVRAEFDHRVAGIKDLLHSVQSTQRILQAQHEDELPHELVEAGIEHVEHAAREVTRIRRSLRNEMAVRRMVKEKKLFEGARPQLSLGSDVDDQRVAPAVGKASAFERLHGALILQRAYRRRNARRHVCRRVGQFWMKVWDESEQRWFYRNDKTKEVTWDQERVPIIDFHDGEDKYLLTPRTFARRKKRGQLEISEIYRAVRTMSKIDAALVMQHAWRRKSGSKKAGRRCAEIYQRIWDKRRQRFYYFNVRTKAVSWKPPAVMSVETAMQVIRTPRSFATHALERQRRMEEEEEAAATAETDEDEDESEDEDEHGGGGEIVERAAPRDP
jgi:hypothetical protein